MRDQVWRSAQQRYLRPLPARLGVTPRGKSRRLERVLTDFGCEHSFERAADSVQEHYGFALGASAVRTASLKQAARARVKLQAQYAQPFRELPAVGQEHVIAQADDTMICTVQPGARKGKRPREWKEMRLVAAQGKDSATTVYGATFGSVAETGRRWGHCARQAGWGQNSRIHAGGNGAAWIRLQCREVFGDQGHFLCDYFHVSEYLAAAAPSCRPARPDQWRHTQQQRLKRGHVSKVLAALAEHLEAAGTPEADAPVCNGHRHVLQARLKKAGAAWLVDHADQIAHLRVLRANHQWSSLWN